jgi:high-affinity nickel-transport protein
VIDFIELCGAPEIRIKNEGSIMTSIFNISLLGLVLGMRHATDPDHVIAVSTIVSKQRGVGKAGLIGVIWGLGHTLTIFLVGASIILFKVAIPARLGLAMELSVGLMLILLGVLNLTGLLRRILGRFLPGSTEVSAAGFGADDSSRTTILGGHDFAEPAARSIGLFYVLRPLVVGIVHGLAGSAAVALLVMTTIRDPWREIGYLLIFGFGTVLGMMVITSVIAVPFIYTARRLSGWNRGMIVASGLLSVSFGVFLSYQIGIVGGLFSAHPHWIPR